MSIDRQSLENFIGLIDIIKNKVKYEKAIAELVSKYDKAQEMVENIVPAKEIEKARSQAHSDRSSATLILKAAQEKATSLIFKARESIDKKNKELEDKLNKLQEKEKQFGKKIAVENSRLGSERSSLIAQQLAAEKLHLEGSRILQEGRELKEEFAERLKKLKLAAS